MAELYLGRGVSPETFDETGGALRFDPDRLTRHAVCLGMTGSGKTGLCVTLLEELAIAGIPLIVIDPKGDMTNLALAFSEHRAEDLEPWVDPAEARRQGISVGELAARTAERWRAGLAAHGVDDARIRRFVEGSRVTVYTPGSTAAIPVDVLGMLRAPSAALRDDPEGLRDLVGGTVQSLLGLVKVDADPVKDPRHVVLARIVEAGWAAGEDLDLERLILRLVDPPFPKVGVFPVDTFFPRADRMGLAMELNGVLAAPGFEVRSQGVPLDVDALLARGGRTPVHVFTLAHLGQEERTFFCALLLNQIVAWSRRQPGSSALRALVYFDEVAGYLPPYPRNPPTKAPVLTLMKQARAVGVGTMLVTQNPVDVDYAALSNAGMWFIGRLSTRQDREKVLDGLAGTGAVDRPVLDGWIERLPPRTFVVRDVSERAPYLLKSRWAVSFLRGPLTRTELGRLAQDVPVPAEGSERPAGGGASGPSPADVDDPLLADVPPTPGRFTTWFVDPSVAFGSRLGPLFERAEEAPRDDGATVWRAGLLARLHLTFDEGREFVVQREEHRLFFPVTDQSIPAGTEPELEPADLLPSAPPGGRFHPLPALVDEERELKALEKRVVEEVLRGETERMYRHARTKLDSRAGESREVFQSRVRAALQERIDDKVAKLKDKVDRDVARLEDRHARLQRELASHQSDLSSRQASEAMNIAETAYAWFTGRKRSLNTAMSKRDQTRRAGERITSTQKELADLARELYDLDAELGTKVQAIENEELRDLEDIQEIEVALERADLRLDQFGVVWVPVTRPPLR